MATVFDVNSLLRTNIKNIQPYSTARDEYTGVALVNLDANENPFGAVDGSKNNRYPDPYQSHLKSIVAQVKGVSEKQIFLGNGSDEAIDLVYTAFCNPGVDNAIVCPPTYGMYKVSADINDVACIEVPLSAEFELQVPAILSAVTKNTKLIWLCSPNNPSGNLLNRSDIHTIVTTFSGIVIIDEAYIDFAPETSWIYELESYPNLIVLQTFSKAWGMANVRLGMMFASEEIIAVINKIKLPYNLNGIVQDYVASILLDGVSEKDRMVSEVLQQRTQVIESLSKFATVSTIYPSDSNFILVKMKDAHNAYMYLVNNGVIVRDRSKIALCADCLRITIGTQEENDLLLKKLQEFYNF